MDNPQGDASTVSATVPEFVTSQAALIESPSPVSMTSSTGAFSPDSTPAAPFNTPIVDDQMEQANSVLLVSLANLTSTSSGEFSPDFTPATPTNTPVKDSKFQASKSTRDSPIESASPASISSSGDVSPDSTPATPVNTPVIKIERASKNSVRREEGAPSPLSAIGPRGLFPTPATTTTQVQDHITVTVTSKFPTSPLLTSFTSSSQPTGFDSSYQRMEENESTMEDSAIVLGTPSVKSMCSGSGQARNPSQPTSSLPHSARPAFVNRYIHDSAVITHQISGTTGQVEHIETVERVYPPVFDEEEDDDPVSIQASDNPRRDSQHIRWAQSLETNPRSVFYEEYDEEDQEDLVFEKTPPLQRSPQSLLSVGLLQWKQQGRRYQLPDPPLPLGPITKKLDEPSVVYGNGKKSRPFIVGQLEVHHFGGEPSIENFRIPSTLKEHHIQQPAGIKLSDDFQLQINAFKHCDATYEYRNGAEREDCCQPDPNRGWFGRYVTRAQLMHTEWAELFKDPTEFFRKKPLFLFGNYQAFLMDSAPDRLTPCLSNCLAFPELKQLHLQVLSKDAFLLAVQEQQQERERLWEEAVDAHAQLKQLEENIEEVSERWRKRRYARQQMPHEIQLVAQLQLCKDQLEKEHVERAKKLVNLARIAFKTVRVSMDRNHTMLMDPALAKKHLFGRPLEYNFTVDQEAVPAPPPAAPKAPVKIPLWFGKLDQDKIGLTKHTEDERYQEIWDILHKFYSYMEFEKRERAQGRTPPPFPESFHAPNPQWPSALKREYGGWWKCPEGNFGNRAERECRLCQHPRAVPFASAEELYNELMSHIQRAEAAVCKQVRAQCLGKMRADREDELRKAQAAKGQTGSHIVMWT